MSRRKRDYPDDGNDDEQAQKILIRQTEGQGLSKVVAKHYNDLEEKGKDARYQSKILYLRNCNNWIKSVLIQETIEHLRQRSPNKGKLVVLDMGCGKGGDIQKWSKSNAVRHVVFADIAETSVEQCRERYKTMASYQRQNVFSAEFISADLTKERLRGKYQDPRISFDLVSIQFAFHYSFESLSQVETMLQNVADNLKIGGRFIGTMPNSDRIVRKYREAGNKSFGNSVYEISFECEEPFPLFGAKYYFKLDEVVNCPEFLVHFPLFVYLAKKFGLKPVYKANFDDFFHAKKKDNEFLLNKMQGLEIYPAGHDRGSKEFEHADVFLQEHRQLRSVGTLSKSEWEAISLYTVFIFERFQL